MEAFVFDVDDTLYDRSMPFKKAYRELYGKQYDVSETALYWATTRRGDEVFEAAQTGKMDMEAAHIYRFQRGFADFGITISDAEALEFRRVYEKKQQEIEISHRMRELLDFCKERGVPMGIITNGTEEHQRRKIEQLGVQKWIPKDRILISGACGMRKPDPRIFAYAREKMNLEENTCYYVGDSYDNDIPGAVRAGWKTVWLNKRGQQAKTGKEVPDHIVGTEEELTACIEAIFMEKYDNCLHPGDKSGILEI